MVTFGNLHLGKTHLIRQKSLEFISKTGVWEGVSQNSHNSGTARPNSLKFGIQMTICKRNKSHFMVNVNISNRVHKTVEKLILHEIESSRFESLHSICCQSSCNDPIYCTLNSF